MNIAGLQKMTLLDYPGRVACTVFLQGCNFRCPFCHNSDLLPVKGEVLMTDAELLAFLKKRQGMLDGVCITGGEPTLQKELPNLLKDIKAQGYCVKLDTNGANPGLLKHVVESGYVDYVAMDIKNSPERYGETAGVSAHLLQPVSESIQFLTEGHVDYEFRTTVVEELHNAESVQSMGAWMHDLAGGKKVKRWFLQSFVDRESVLFSNLNPPKVEDLRQYAEILTQYAWEVGLRGVD